MDERPAALQHWHRVVQERDPGQLSDLLAQEAVFHSPVMHRPQEGRDLVAMYLTGAMQVLANTTRCWSSRPWWTDSRSTVWT